MYRITQPCLTVQAPCEKGLPPTPAGCGDGSALGSVAGGLWATDSLRSENGQNTFETRNPGAP